MKYIILITLITLSTGCVSNQRTLADRKYIADLCKNTNAAEIIKPDIEVKCYPPATQVRFVQ